MLYIDHMNYKEKYYIAQREFDKILSEKEMLFARTQPKAIDVSKERVSGGSPTNSFDSYLIAKEKKQIDRRLVEARILLDDRERLLRAKEHELRQSNQIEDRIYTYKYIDNLKVYKICSLVGYGEAQVYRYLNQIRKNIKR